MQKTRKLHCCSQEHTVKKENNTQSVTCVPKLSLSQMSIIKKFSEPNFNSDVYGPCDACGLPTTPRARSGHDATNRRLLNEVFYFATVVFSSSTTSRFCYLSFALSTSDSMVTHVRRALHVVSTHVPSSFAEFWTHRLLSLFAALKFESGVFL